MQAFDLRKVAGIAESILRGCEDTPDDDDHDWSSEDHVTFFLISRAIGATRVLKDHPTWRLLRAVQATYNGSASLFWDQSNKCDCAVREYLSTSVVMITHIALFAVIPGVAENEKLLQAFERVDLKLCASFLHAQDFSVDDGKADLSYLCLQVSKSVSCATVTQ